MRIRMIKGGWGIVADVIVDIAHSDVDQPFTYLVPPELKIAPGQRVTVPFGRGNALKEGFVICLSESAPEGAVRFKSIVGMLEPYTALLPDQLKLCEWLKQTYHCLTVDALRLMIPAQMRGGRVKESRVRMVGLCEGCDAERVRAAMLDRTGKAKAPRQIEVFDLLAASKTFLSVSDIESFIPGAGGAIHKLIEKGVLVEMGSVTFRSPFPQLPPASEPLVLTKEQEDACSRISKAQEHDTGAFLLHGVTGSGKTEVYLCSIARTIERGRTAIVLVPEISLTPQIVDSFRARFGERVAVLHSRLSAGERYDEWRRIRTGRVDVVIGARSAVFAPLERLGLVVVDEEHEPSYLSEQIPAYNAIEVAIKRCQLTGSTLVLGSATPSITSYYRAQRGRYELIELCERPCGARMPEIEISDMRREFLTGNNSIFGETLLNRLRACVEAGEQAILFVNRRGYSTFVSCRGCGYVFECGDCDVSMTYHKTDGVLRCHYCGKERRLPEVCPSCGKRYIKYFGVGTQQVEEQMKKLLPDVKTLRMDMDTTRTKDAHRTMLESFARGEAQVLVGTQMIAKGLDFPNVTLVGVIAADSLLHLPDYRSYERTFQLITQVSGRAGRAKSPGHVVIQAYTPEHPVIQFAAHQDYKGFYAYELDNRKVSLFPPFSIFVRVLFSGVNEAGPMQEADRFKEGLEYTLRAYLEKRGLDPAQLLLILAAPAPVKRRQAMYRYHVLVKLLRTGNTAGMISEIYRYADANRSLCFTALLVNPQDMF